jgi:hypothetical protein
MARARKSAQALRRRSTNMTPSRAISNRSCGGGGVGIDEVERPSQSALESVEERGIELTTNAHGHVDVAAISCRSPRPGSEEHGHHDLILGLEELAEPLGNGHRLDRTIVHPTGHRDTRPRSRPRARLELLRLERASGRPQTFRRVPLSGATTSCPPSVATLGLGRTSQSDGGSVAATLSPDLRALEQR